MSFIRPDAHATLMRWRECIIGVLVFAVGLWWTFGLGGLLTWIGALDMLAGAALVFIGIQRGRFRTGAGGPGLVQVDEGRITYFGPLSGGSADLSDITRIDVDTTGKPAHWRVVQPGQPPLSIPVTAEGSETLFDAFAALPGLATGAMVAKLNAPGRGVATVWRRPSDIRPASVTKTPPGN